MYKKYKLSRLRTVHEDFWFQEIAEHIEKTGAEGFIFFY